MKFKITESKKSAIWSLVYRVAVNHTMDKDEFFTRMEKLLACDDAGEPVAIVREDGKPFQVECEKCEGTGSIDVDTGDDRSDNEPVKDSCASCHGIGVTEPEEAPLYCLPKRWRKRSASCSADVMDAFNWAADELEGLLK